MPLSKWDLERLIEASPDIVVATDAGGTVAYYNDGARENLGYSRDEIIGQDVTRLYPDRDEAKRVKAAMRSRDGGEAGRVVNFPTTFVAKDGHQIPVSISGVILYSPDRREEGTIGFARDLREILRKDQLALLGEIAIGLSHEINNPLEIILNQLSLLERSLLVRMTGPEGATERNRIRSIRREIDRIEDQLRRLNEMAEHDEYASTSYLGDARMIDLSSGRTLAAGPLAGRRVLVVDDDPGVLESVSEILRVEGCEVVSAGGGRQALDEIDKGAFDLVLSDVVMPDVDGYEIFLETRRRSPSTFVVLMTAFYYDREHIIKRSRVEGLDGVLFKKPVDPDRLRETLSGMFTLPRPGPS